MKPFIKKVLLRAVQVAIIGVTGVFLFRDLWRNWQEVAGELRNIRSGPLVASYAVLAANYLFVVYLWKRFLEKAGGRLSFLKALRISALTELGRYLPGKFWGYLGRAYLCQREGVAIPKTFAGTVLATGFYLAGGVIAGSLSFLLWGGVTRPERVAYLVAAALVIGVCFSHKLLNIVLAWGARMAGRPPEPLNVRATTVLSSLCYYTGSWLVMGVAFFLLVAAFQPVSLRMVPAMTGVTATSFLVGFAAVVVPAGLGVREGTMALYLGRLLPPHSAVLLAICARLWITLFDLSLVLGYGVVRLLRLGTHETTKNTR